jgi:hypothetical protein
LDAQGNLKISDFGMARLYIGDPDAAGEARAELLHTTCGTPNYVAPEVLTCQGYDGQKADVWSMGVILYVLLAGYLPFEESTTAALFKKIKAAEFEYPKWFSESVRNILDLILVVDPDHRISLKEFKESVWINKDDVAAPLAPTRTATSQHKADQGGDSDDEKDGKKGTGNSTPVTPMTPSAPSPVAPPAPVVTTSPAAVTQSSPPGAPVPPPADTVATAPSGSVGNGTSANGHANVIKPASSSVEEESLVPTVVKASAVPQLQLGNGSAEALVPTIIKMAPVGTTVDNIPTTSALAEKQLSNSQLTPLVVPTAPAIPNGPASAPGGTTHTHPSVPPLPSARSVGRIPSYDVTKGPPSARPVSPVDGRADVGSLAAGAFSPKAHHAQDPPHFGETINSSRTGRLSPVLNVETQNTQATSSSGTGAAVAAAFAGGDDTSPRPVAKSSTSSKRSTPTEPSPTGATDNSTPSPVREARNPRVDAKGGAGGVGSEDLAVDDDSNTQTSPIPTFFECLCNPFSTFANKTGVKLQ